MVKTRKAKETNKKTRKKREKKISKKVKFGNSIRCESANKYNRDNGKLITIAGELMVVTNETTTFK